MRPEIQHIGDSDSSGFQNFLDFGFQLKMINEDRENVVNLPPLINANWMLKFKVRKDVVQIYSFKYLINLSIELILNNIFIFIFQLSYFKNFSPSISARCHCKLSMIKTKYRKKKAKQRRGNFNLFI